MSIRKRDAVRTDTCAAPNICSGLADYYIRVWWGGSVLFFPMEKDQEEQMPRDGS